MKKKKTSKLFRFLRWLLGLVYTKFGVEGAEKIPDEPVIFVANHCHAHGPLVGEYYAPRAPYAWCAGEMMHLKTVPAYAFRDFWGYKPKWSRWFYRLLSYLIAPLAVLVFNNARTIGVYHDTRVLSTFKKTVEHLAEGDSVLIFPEHDADHNHIVCDFQDKFIDVAKLYHKRTGKAVAFVPIYIAPNLKCQYVGEPIRYDPTQPMETQRRVICDYLMDAITDIACNLPEHTVIPYRNIAKKYYPSNLEKE